MEKNIELNIVNTHELDPNKRYLIELDSRYHSHYDAKNIVAALSSMNISSITVLVKEPESLKITEMSSDDTNE